MTTRSQPALPPERLTLGAFLGRIFFSIYSGLMTTVELVIDPIQRVIGVNRMAYFFVLPNLLI
ncbi:MAG: sugar ABC transporter permease, partial [Caldilinea sp.]|nr:sugar ABC transporter permease [Caldilinea sp.]MDW8439371.1 sugar ABC transporter permease [Caldilineaceae bacterium]